MYRDRAVRLHTCSADRCRQHIVNAPESLCRRKQVHVERTLGRLSAGGVFRTAIARRGAHVRASAARQLHLGQYLRNRIERYGQPLRPAGGCQGRRRHNRCARRSDRCGHTREAHGAESRNIGLPHGRGRSSEARRQGHRGRIRTGRRLDHTVDDGIRDGHVGFRRSLCVAKAGVDVRRG